MTLLCAASLVMYHGVALPGTSSVRAMLGETAPGATWRIAGVVPWSLTSMLVPNAKRSSGVPPDCSVVEDWSGELVQVLHSVMVLFAASMSHGLWALSIATPAIGLVASSTVVGAPVVV